MLYNTYLNIEGYQLFMKYIKNFPFEIAHTILPEQEIKRRFLMHPEKNFFYCSNPKCASTTFKRILIEDIGIEFRENEAIHKKARKNILNVENVIEKYPSLDFNDLYKFCIIRDPLERLASAISNAKSGLSDEEIKSLTKRSLAVHVRKVIRIGNRNTKRLNLHIRPQVLNLLTDSIKYDQIAKMNNLDKELELLASKTNINIGNFHLNKSNKTNTIAEMLLDNKNIMSVIEDFYAADFELYNQ